MEGVDLPVEHGALRVQYHLDQGGMGKRLTSCLPNPLWVATMVQAVIAMASACFLSLKCCGLVVAVRDTYSCDENHPCI